MSTKNLPWVVLVTGPPAGGKSSLAGVIAGRLGMPLIGKDDLKEILFDTLGWGEPRVSRQLSDATYELIYHLIGVEVAVGRSLVVEANFRADAGLRLRQVAGRHPFRSLQIYCFAEMEVLLERLGRRAEGDLRHPGHLDAELLQRATGLVEASPPIDIEGPLLEVDTTDSGPDIENVLMLMAEFLAADVGAD